MRNKLKLIGVSLSYVLLALLIGALPLAAVNCDFSALLMSKASREKVLLHLTQSDPASRQSQISHISLGRAMALVREAPHTLEKLPEAQRPTFMATWETLARDLASRTTPEQKAAMARVLIGELQNHTLDWKVQPRLDRMIDTILGMDAEAVTRRIQGLSQEEVARKYGGENTWYEYDNSMLLTPYAAFQQALTQLDVKPGQTFVDLGSGMGRMGLYMGIVHPGVKFHGYEIVGERVQEGAHAAKALGLPDVHFHEQNMSDPNWKPEAADFYYAFNPVSDTTFDKILTDLKSQAIQHGKPFKLAVSGPAPYFKLEANSAWLKEITPPKPFGSEDFTRIFEFDPRRAPHNGSVGSQMTAAAPAFPATRPLAAIDKAEVEAAMGHGKPNLSMYSFPYLWAQSTSKPQSLSRLNGLLLISKEGTAREQKIYLEPIGGSVPDRAEAIRAILKAAKPGEHITFQYVSSEVADHLEYSVKDDRQLASVVTATLGISPHPIAEPKITQHPDFAEYVYATKDLVDMQATKKLRDKKKQVETFWASHQAKYQSLNEHPELLPKVMEFLETWVENRLQIDQSPAFKAEAETSRRMTQNFLQLGIKGGVLLVDGEVAGYTLGASMDAKTFGVFVEKADPKKFQFAYQALNNSFAKELQADNFEFVNRQDDEGMEGLRQAKRSYHPLLMEPHFTVESP